MGRKLGWIQKGDTDIFDAIAREFATFAVLPPRLHGNMMDSGFASEEADSGDFAQRSELVTVLHLDSSLARLSLLVVLVGFNTSSALGQQSSSLGDLSFTPGNQTGNHDTVYDLTKTNVSISYEVDLSGVTKTDPALGPYLEVGLREVGAENFNPGVFGQHPGGKGGWMISGVGDLSTSSRQFDVDDKHNLQSAGDLDETKYDAVTQSLVTEPFGTLSDGIGIYFDRDGVAGNEDGTQANTGGVYQIVVDFQATDATQGTMFATVNGLKQGFMPGLNGDIDHAGASFTGDMTQMQVFWGGLMGDGTGTIALNDLTVTSTPVPEPVFQLIAGFFMLGLVGWSRSKRS